MAILVFGLLLFFGMHLVHVVAGPWRTRQIARFGVNAYKGIYSLISLAGFILIIWGYSQTRDVAELWLLPRFTRHLAALFTLPAFILLVAAYVPGNHLKAKIGHPMLAGVKLWALAHLLCNARPGDVLLFGTFLAWSVLTFVCCRRRDRAQGVQYRAGKIGATLTTIGIGALAWAGFAFFGHAWLIGVRPFA